MDFVEFSYYHEQRENRRMRLQTYVVDPRNPSLTAARNVKKEIRGDVVLGRKSTHFDLFP